MKSLFTLIAALLLSLSAAAQSGQGYLNFNYQAVIRNSSGALLTNRQVGVRISILQGSATGTAAYVETHTPTTNANGLMSLEIGGGTAVSGNFFSLVWPQGTFFLKTETDPLGGTNYTITGTTQLLSVPYAMYAQVAARVQGHYIGEFFGGGIIFSLWRDHLGVEHGMIASLDDLGVSAWATPVITSQAIATSTSDGAANTAAIVGQVGSVATNSAAGLCDAYIASNYTDWYLPAVEELQLLQRQAIIINAILGNDNNTATNGFADQYWSSTRAGTIVTDQLNEESALTVTFRDEARALRISNAGTGVMSRVVGQIIDYRQRVGAISVRAIRRF